MQTSQEEKFHQLSLIRNAVNFPIPNNADQMRRPGSFCPTVNNTEFQLNRKAQSENAVSNPAATLSLEDFILSEKPNVKFSDIGGLLDVKEAINLEMVYPKLHPDLYSRYNKKPGAGILLWGPPGCGKTLIAKAVAAEIEALFIAPKISDLMSRWLGESEKMVSRLFEYARKHDGQTVLFFDEFDSLVPKNGPSYQQRIKNQFLEELDGIDSKKEGLLVLAATNRPFCIDTAVRRPGRFEKTIFISPPDIASRNRIFEINLSPLMKNRIVNEEVRAYDLAEITEGYSGADIKAICDVARDTALSECLSGATEKKISMEDFYAAIKKTPLSILPWINDTLNYAKRTNEENYYPELRELRGIAQSFFKSKL